MKYLDLTSLTWKQLVLLKQALLKFETKFKTESALSVIKNLNEFSSTIENLGKELYFPDNEKSLSIRNMLSNEVKSINDASVNIANLIKDFSYDLSLTRIAIETRIHEIVKLKQAKYESFMFDKTPVVDPYFTTIINDKEIIKQFNTLISTYTDFRYPALLITPVPADVINGCVGFDPLYIFSMLDYDRKEIENLFNEKYLNRLRIYDAPKLKTWPEYIKALSVFPSKQYALIIPYVILSSLPYSAVSAFIKETQRILRPGGTCCFIYINIESTRSLFSGGRNEPEDELGFMVNHMLYQDYESLIKESGFNLLHNIPFQHCSIVVYQKPGKLDTVKAAQALGEIEE